MSDILHAIQQRRSVRVYTDQPVPEKLIHELIEAACFAPSGINNQPWRFIVVTNRSVQEDLAQKAIITAWPVIEKFKSNFPEQYKSLKESFDMLHDPVFYRAPVIIFIIGNGRFSETACAFAAQNLMIAATALGLGSCWAEMGQTLEKDHASRRILSVQKGESMCAAVTVGYEEGTSPEIPRKKTDIGWI